MGSGSGLWRTVSSHPMMISGISDSPQSASRFSILYLILPETMPILFPRDFSPLRAFSASGNGTAPQYASDLTTSKNLLLNSS